VGSGSLSNILAGLPVIQDKNLVVGFDGKDDAAVYDIGGGQLLISTADFFPPMVDCACTFGKIAAANALSDVYAMGGRPLFALNLTSFTQDLSEEIVREILRGGAEKLVEAGAVLAGGHSIYGEGITYGLAVTGVVDEKYLLRNNTPKAGHSLILTKPLGTGFVMAALKAGEANEDNVNVTLKSMQRLNKYAAEKLDGFDVSACTDVTGFGLAGHALEMAGDNFTITLYADKIPLLPSVIEYAEKYETGGGKRNKKYADGKTKYGGANDTIIKILCDPQTSGGLLIAVKSDEADKLLSYIQTDDPAAEIVGMVSKFNGFSIKIV